MLPQKYLYYIDKRLKQLKKCSRAFGGVVIVMIGDISQLPPVQQIPVWDDRYVNDNGKQKDDDSLFGMSLWFTHFRTVVKLEKNNRLDQNDPDSVIAAEILEGISVGELTDKNFDKIITTCSRNTMLLQKWKERGFEDDLATWLFPKNDQVLKHNYDRLKKLQNPILKVDAKNSSKSARAKKSDFFQNLENHLYLSVEALVLLIINLCPSIGLANGSTGIIKQIVWNSTAIDETISDADNMFVWVDFGHDYKGESFFPGDEGKKGWFPIFSKVVQNTERNNSNNKGYLVHERSMLPLKLSWAWTIHKSQGQTMKNKVIIDLGKDETTLGLAYVAFLRATKLSNIGIVGGVTKERLTTVIQNKKSLERRIKADKLLDNLEIKTKLLCIKVKNSLRHHRDVLRCLLLQ